MRILVFAASLRQDSCNKKLARVAAKCLEQIGYQFDLADFSEFASPLYDGDKEAHDGLPAQSLHFIERCKNANGMLICSPEYNFSTPGTLKNLIDWVSRVNPVPIAKYPVMLCSASPARAGGARGLTHTVVTLLSFGVYVFPQHFSLSTAYEAFTPEGDLKDQHLQEILIKNLHEFITFIKKMG